jgi:sugar lactone lactonase YvrE
MRARALVAALAAACASAAPAHDVRTLAASYPEGPLWRGERLYYAEMGADRVTFHERGETRAFFAQRGCGPTAIAPYGEGFVVLCHLGARLVAVNGEGRETRRWERDASGAPLMDPNDASADGAGGVYFSDPGLFTHEAPAQGYVMRLSAEGAVTRVAGPLHYPNGVHVAGAALYVSEHLGGRVLRFPILVDGRLGEMRVLADLRALPTLTSRYAAPYPRTGPDGLEIGPDGLLYVTIYGEGRVLRLTPQGAFAGAIETPTRFVTNIAFSASGAAAITGAFDNARAPFPGEVSIHAPGELSP